MSKKTTCPPAEPSSSQSVRRGALAGLREVAPGLYEAPRSTSIFSHDEQDEDEEDDDHQNESEG